jgi:hypothetical protein
MLVPKVDWKHRFYGPLTPPPPQKKNTKEFYVLLVVGSICVARFYFFPDNKDPKANFELTVCLHFAVLGSLTIRI